VLGVGEAHPATAQADDEVRCDNLGRETARAVPAADRARVGADTRPQPELLHISATATSPPCAVWPLAGTISVRSFVSSNV
jgi:hypothetical protein